MSLYLDKVCLVTGSNRGVGRVIAEHFLNQGAQVVGLSRGPSGWERSGYTPLQADVGQPKEVQDALLKVGKLLGRLDVLVNNAAVLTSQYSLIMPPANAQAMVQTNLLGTFFVSREAVKLMKKRKTGRIINIGSMAASLEPVGDSLYAACKAAVATLANVMAREFASYNVTCNTLGITAFETDMLRQLPREKIEAIIQSLPVARYATEDDILNVVDFFASDRSSYITAQTVYLGGIH